MVAITAGLLDVLLEMAEDAEPGDVTIRLAVTAAGELSDDLDVDPSTPVFSDLYFPASGDSIEAVFGVDVSIPPGQTPGIFISHPQGPREITQTDDFAERLFIATPPWTRESVAAFDRQGRDLPLEIIDAQALDGHTEDGS